MNVYSVYCYSDCGSYFSSYLKKLTIIAASNDEAIVYAKNWCKINGEHFIKPENKWECDILCEVAEGVIDSLIDSDY